MQEKIEISTVVVNKELRDLFPALDSTEYQFLEESILKEGCTDPIIVWNGVIIDGYLVSLDNTLRQYSPGMRTAENDKKVDKAIQYAAQRAVRLRDRYLEPGEQ